MLAGNDDRGMVVTDFLHGFGEMASGVAIGNSVHVMSLLLYMYKKVYNIMAHRTLMRSPVVKRQSSP
jgi:hypothetical protein